MEQQQVDLFGNPIETKGDLKKEFGANPFSILDTKDGLWQARKRKWINLGIQSEVGRDAVTYHMKDWADKKGQEGTLSGNKLPSDTSIFDPVLCEMMYRWYCPQGGSILDPFAGGSVRGIFANYLGYHYSGIDIRQEQVDSNREQALTILGVITYHNGMLAIPILFSTKTGKSSSTLCLHARRMRTWRFIQTCKVTYQTWTMTILYLPLKALCARHVSCLKRVAWQL